MIATIDNKGGGVKLVDINPDKAYTGSYYYVYTVSGSAGTSIPVQGYDKIYLRTGSARTASYSFLDKNMQAISSGTFSNSSWLELSIPKNALLMYMQCTNAAGSGALIYYSLLV